MQALTRTALTSVVLILLAVFGYSILNDQVVPRLTASTHSDEMCDVLRKFQSTRVEIFNTGAISRLGEIYSSRWIEEEAQRARTFAELGVLEKGVTRIVACKAVYFTPARAEIEATTWSWFKFYDKKTGQPTTPTGSQIDESARESRFWMAFVNDQGSWKYADDTEYSWRYVNAESPWP